MQRLTAEIALDRAALRDVMGAPGIPVRTGKVCAAWIGEKAIRLKFRGRASGQVIGLWGGSG